MPNTKQIEKTKYKMKELQICPKMEQLFITLNLTAFRFPP